MSSEVIKSLYRYNTWVTEKLLTVAEAASLEQWQETHAGGR